MNPRTLTDLRIRRWSSAEPTSDPGPSVLLGNSGPNPNPVTIAVLDTGLFPGFVDPRITVRGGGDDDTDSDGDRVLDTDAGHGTFVTGIIRRLAPEAEIVSTRVLDSFGVGNDATLLAGLRALMTAPVPDIINLSLGAYTMDDAGGLSVRLQLEQLMDMGITIVAAAGNDATSRPFYPAALPGVISVGALGPNGPARFTNRGSWVDACATGVDVVSRFANFTEELPFGQRAFNGWARWSGTSFAAPRVAAAIARRRALTGRTIDEVVADLIYASDIVRIPCLGAMVNVL